MKKSQEIAAKIDELRTNVENIVTLCEREGRDLNAQEQKVVDAALGAGNDAGEISRLTAELDRQKRIEAEASVRIRETLGPALRQQMVDAGMGRTSDGPVLFRNQATGQPIRCYYHGERMNPNGNPHAIGELVQAAVIGRKSWMSDGVLAAMSTGSNSAGGFTVPSEIWSSFVDLARAQAVLLRAGTGVIEMPAAETNIVGIASDPSFEVKAENAAFSGSDVTFRQISLQSKTIGNTVRMSRELFEDGLNVASIVSQVLARAFASSLDSMALTGASGQSLYGLFSRDGIGSTGSVGAIAWEDAHLAVTAVREANHMPNAMICHPTILGDLQVIKGTDSWFGPPPSLDGVQLLSSTNCPLAKAVAGNFALSLFGVRRAASLEISIDGDDFQTHSVSMKLVWRGDYAVLDDSAFYTLTGITS